MAPATKVLVVEDDRHTREIIQRILTRDPQLRHLSIQVVQAADGEEGIERFLDQQPELVIVDLLLPRVNGFKVIETIRAQPRGGACPILVTTGVYRDRATLKQLEDKGVVLQLKPFLPKIFADTVRRMLVKPRDAGRSPEKTPPRTPRSEERPAGSEGTVLAGDIAEVGLPQLLLEALEEQLNGSLEIQRGKVRKVIHLMAGHPIFVQSNLRSETLGQLLVRRGKISQEQHGAAVDLSKQEGIKYGEALVRLGHMTDGEVMEELCEQTRLKITSCLGWPDGRFVFTEDPEVERKVPRCLVDPLHLVLEGLQRRTDVEQAFVRLAQRSWHRVRLTRRFSLHRERFEALFGRTVTDVITGEHEVQEVIRRAGTPQTAVLQLDLMLRAGLAELDEPEEGERDHPPVPEAMGAAPMALEGLAAREPAPAPEPASPPDAWEESSAVVWLPTFERARRPHRPQRNAEEVQVALQLIQSTYLRLHEADHYQILGVTPHSDADSIEVAYQIKRKQFDLGSFRDLDLGEHYAHLEEICAALDAAYAVLGDVDQRAAYDRSRGRSPSQEERSLALTAEMHCRRGEELFNREKFSKAVDAFAKAVELDEQAEYVSKYALALFMARRPGGEQKAAADAMLVVQEALVSDPSDQTAHLVAATICQEAGHAGEAVHHLEELVKASPAHREAFDQLERLLLEQGDPEALELQYRRTLHLLGDRDRSLAGDLWRRLARLYRDELHDLGKARTAFEVALRLVPDDRELREQLAALDQGEPDRWPQAALGYRSLLTSDPEQPAPIHRLFELHRAGGRRDAAYLAASAALLRGVADDEERRFVEQHRARSLRRVTRQLETGLLEQLRHPDDDPSLATLFRVLSPLVHRLHPLALSDLGVERNEIIPPSRLPEGFVSVMRYAAEQLSLDIPDIALNPELGAEVQSAASSPPLLLCGVEALEGEDRLALAFRMARAFYLLSPGRRLALWHPRRTLRDYVLAAFSVAFPAVEVPDAAGTVARVRAAIAGSDLEVGVRDAVDHLRQRGGVGLNLAHWQRGIQRTAERVGLLLCADLPTAGGILAGQDREAERDLVDFALGETHGELRASLGLAVE